MLCPGRVRIKRVHHQLSPLTNSTFLFSSLKRFADAITSDGTALLEEYCEFTLGKKAGPRYASICVYFFSIMAEKKLEEIYNCGRIALDANRDGK